MTIHFAFFLLDVTIWLIMGFFLGKILDTTESVAKKRRGRNGLLFMGIAFLSGCWSVLTRGLPDQGISLNSIAMVGFAIFGIGILRAPRFRKIVVHQVSHVSLYYAKLLHHVNKLRNFDSTP